MKKRYLPRRSWMILTAAMIALSAGGLLAAKPALAGELDKLDSSLKLIPANAAFYSTMLRNREQFDAFMQSNAYAKLKSMPSIQMGLGMYNAQAQQPDSPVAKFQGAMENPEIKRLVNLAADMGSNEIYIYGDENCVDFAKLMQYIASNMRYGPAVLEATGEAKSLNGNKVQAKLLLETLVDHLDLVKFPDMLIGFHLKKPSAANEALIKLEMILNTTLAIAPQQFKGVLNRETIGDNEYLVLRLNGTMIPWKEVPLDEFKKLVEDEKDFQKLVEHVKGMQFVVAMGVRDKDLVISMGSSIDCIKKLGTGERLVDRQEFKPLEKFADKRLASIGYVSKSFNEQINNNEKNIADLRDFLVQMIPLAKLTDQQNDQVTKDVEVLAADLVKSLPVMGTIMNFSFITENGFEGYQYNWSTHPGVVGSKPLGLLKHMGGNPLLGVVGRGKVSIEDYDAMNKWAKIGWKYMEELALPKLPGEEREKAAALLKDLKPLLVRLNTATRDMLLPALADGQIGMVIDAKLTSKQLVREMPELKKELPIIEPALVLGVSDAELLRKAMGEFRSVYNDLIDLIRKQKDVDDDFKNKIVNFKWPEAKASAITDGSVYSYPLPAEWGVDKNIVPNAGLSDKVAVLTMSPKQTELLLREIPLKVGGVLTTADKPLAAAAWIDWTETVRAITPWVNYVLEQQTDQQLGGQKESIIAQAKTVLEVLSTIKSLTSETYAEGNSLVTHSLLEIHDLSN